MDAAVTVLARKDLLESARPSRVMAFKLPMLQLLTLPTLLLRTLSRAASADAVQGCFCGRCPGFFCGRCPRLSADAAQASSADAAQGSFCGRGPWVPTTAAHGFQRQRLGGPFVPADAGPPAVMFTASGADDSSTEGGARLRGYIKGAPAGDAFGRPSGLAASTGGFEGT
ncbi:hypothetical protein V5799_019219 [Amblyomma americanum]|uniref:Uncharacterized protein n=1 Tax=Amblyomma americanum TaxID=6943 RepID=A0AAQ4EXE8_AMBAM